MDCPKCGQPDMEKGYVTTEAEDKDSLVTLWRCEKCGHRERSQHNVQK